MSGTGDDARDEALTAARGVGRVWTNSRYYEDAEPYTELVWETVSPYLEGCDFSVSVDLAAGHGRHSTNLLPRSRELYIVDMTPENIEFCRTRFGDDPRVTYLVNDGLSLDAIPSASVTLVFCFDAMVHFDSDTVREYLREFARILVPGRPRVLPSLELHGQSGRQLARESALAQLHVSGALLPLRGEGGVADPALRRNRLDASAGAGLLHAVRTPRCGGGREPRRLRKWARWTSSNASRWRLRRRTR